MSSQTPEQSSAQNDCKIMDELFEAAKTGQSGVILRICSLNPSASLLMTTHRDAMCGNLAIHYTAVNGHIDTLHLLVRSGSDVNSRNDYGWSPLILAAYHNQINMTKFLLGLPKIEKNLTTDFGLTALICAIHRNSLQIVRLLIDNGVEVNRIEGGKQASTGSGYTTLMIACQAQNSQVILLLLEKGAECNAQCRLNGWTALMYAANSGCGKAVINALLEHGADLYVKAWNGQTALDVAKFRSNHEVAELLRVSGHVPDSRVTSPDVKSTTTVRHCIFDAISYDQNALVISIVQLDPTAMTERDPSDGFTALHLAAVKGEMSLLHLFLQKGARINASDNLGWNALAYAAYYNHIDAVELLIQNGAILPVKTLNDVDRTLQDLTNNIDIINFLRNVVKLVTAESTLDSSQQPDSSSTNGKPSKWFSKLLHSNKKGKKEPQPSSSQQIQPSSTVSPTSIAETMQKMAITPVKASRKKTSSYDSATMDIVAPATNTSPVTNTWNKKDARPSAPPSIAFGNLMLSDMSLTSPFDDVGKFYNSLETPESNRNSLRHRRDRSDSSNKFHMTSTTISPKTTLILGADDASNGIYDAQTIPAFLALLDFSQYEPLYTKSGIELMSDAVYFNDADLQRLGIESAGHRRLILLSNTAWRGEHQKYHSRSHSRMDSSKKSLYPSSSNMMLDRSFTGHHQVHEAEEDDGRSQTLPTSHRRGTDDNSTSTTRTGTGQYGAASSNSRHRRSASGLASRRVSTQSITNSPTVTVPRIQADNDYFPQQPMSPNGAPVDKHELIALMKLKKKDLMASSDASLVSTGTHK